LSFCHYQPWSQTCHHRHLMYHFSMVLPHFLLVVYPVVTYLPLSLKWNKLESEVLHPTLCNIDLIIATVFWTAVRLLLFSVKCSFSQIPFIHDDADCNANVTRGSSLAWYEETELLLGLGGLCHSLN
jgi:hypothetical protein